MIDKDELEHRLDQFKRDMMAEYFPDHIETAFGYRKRVEAEIKPIQVLKYNMYVGLEVCDESSRDLSYAKDIKIIGKADGHTYIKTMDASDIPCLYIVKWNSGYDESGRNWNEVKEGE